MLQKLAQLREERADGDKGFTLIELLVVVVIIGVLVAIAIPLYLNYRKGAENRSAQSDVRNAVSAVESCIGDNQGVPPTGTGITADGSANAKVINLACNSTGTVGAAAAAAAASTAAGAEVINVSDGVTLVYNYVSATKSYTLDGSYSGTGKTYHYDSTTGKTS